MTIPIQTPYLLFLGDAPDELAVKTARGTAHWRPELCVGELRYENCGTTLGLPEMTLETGIEGGAKTLMIGIANRGGVISDRWLATMREALERGYDLASGLHSRLRDIPELLDLANKHGRSLHDVRHPTIDLPIGSGAPRSGKRVLTVGTDCSVGKMYTALAIERELQARKIPSTFRATGQTGILITGSGISVDAVVSDFLSGCVEMLTPANDPDHWDIIEGQGSLFHPSFAGVSLGLLHGSQADAMILCHEPTRTKMRGVDYPLRSIEACIEANEQAARLTKPKSRVTGIAINTSALPWDEALAYLEKTTTATGLPCSDPVRTGVTTLVDRMLSTCPS